jgi:uncharacterized protein
VPASPMFPLGSVLVPGMLLPLHVFEPRYRRLVHDCLAGDGEFGVVLIERGSEVGGGDVRTDAGTMARIVRADDTPDGRFAVVALGVRRIRVDGWLDDDPYPRADVSDWPDPPDRPAEADAGTRLDDTRLGDTTSGDTTFDEVVALVRRAAALASELGEQAVPLDVELAADPVLASYQATAVAPLGPMDRQALLCAPSVPERMHLLRELLTDRIELLMARLAAG